MTAYHVQALIRTTRILMIMAILTLIVWIPAWLQDTSRWDTCMALTSDGPTEVFCHD